MVLIRLMVVLGLLALLPGAENQRPRAAPGGEPPQGFRGLDVTLPPCSMILARPTATAITLNILCAEEETGCVRYGTQPGTRESATSARTFPKGEPVTVVLEGLRPDTAYSYRFHGSRSTSDEVVFHTARPPGRSFTCTVIADSHLDVNTDPALYQRTLANARRDAPDFHLDLGDTFMTEKHPTRESAARQYLAQRFYLGPLGASAPLLWILGNHDGEYPRGRDDGTEDLALWSNRIRTRHFPNPVPDGFYSGNATPHPQAGPLQDYYAWAWGDAQFIVLDPFWNTRRQGVSGNWKRTLGTEQYQWLERTLATGSPRYRFVFIHHLVGGADRQARGGSEAAGLYEWGGHETDGKDTFAVNRPGWALPIHQLLVRHGVATVFHGHDHLYAQQEADGIIYQAVPQPGHAGGDEARSATEYGYRSGIILGTSGHIRLGIGPDQATVDLVRTDGSTARHYLIPPHR